MSEADQSTLASTGVGGAGVHGSVAPAIHVTDTYRWSSPAEKPTYDYSRTVNPNRDLLLEALVALEAGSGGAITNSGQSAALLATLMLEQQPLIVAPHDCYGGTYRLLAGLRDKLGADVRFVDLSRVDDVTAALSTDAQSKLLWLETPSNPLMRLQDIRLLGSVASNNGALCLVDNTVMTPVRQKPLQLGADIVLHSTTKAINGHHDVTGGALIVRDSVLAEKAQWWCNAAGLAASATDSAQTLRGLRTLSLRVAQQEESASQIARFLLHHEQVEAVHYPGLPSHPDYVLGQMQMSGPGFLMSFEIRGSLEPACDFVSSLKRITLASSLGGFASLICLPATMTHRGMPADAQQAAGITPGLLRLSVGLEDAHDLMSDLRRAFNAIG